MCPRDVDSVSGPQSTVPQTPDPAGGHAVGAYWAQEPGRQKAETAARGCAHRGALISDLGLEGLGQLVKPEPPAVGGGAHTGKVGGPVLGTQCERVRTGHGDEMWVRVWRAGCPSGCVFHL